MECERITEKVQAHAFLRMQSVETAHDCRISLPLLEPNGDSITVAVERDPRSGTYRVTDGGRLNGLLFESSPATPSPTDRRLVADIAKRATLEFDTDKRVFYVVTESRMLGYWAFEVGRTIATVASVVPQKRRRRAGRRLSKYVISQLEKELIKQGLRNLIRGPRNIRGVTNTERRVDLSYRTRREPLGDPDNVTDVFVIAADIGATGPAKAAQDAAIAAHDLSALDDEPITRIVHGVVHEAESANGRAEQARRLIESVASAPRIEQYSWDDNDHKKVFVEKTRDELGRRDRASASLTTTAP